jgi:hypothetical protein
MSTLAILLATALTILAALHLYWAFGGFWPGRDAATLARTVVGSPVDGPMPSALACAGVAVVLMLASSIVLVRGGVLALPVPSALVRFAALAVAGVLTVRGVGGFLETRLRPVIIGSPYAQLNVALYSPLALVLGVATFALAL